MYIVADIGGTNTRVAASRDLETMSEPVIYDTPKSYTEALGTFSRIIETVAKGEKVKGIVAGLPVLLSADKRIIDDATNLPDWSGKSFAVDIERHHYAQVHLENDVALVALGEAVFGAGKGKRIIMYLTVSTGVNGARIVDGTIDDANIGYSIGAQYVSMNEANLDWEHMISGKSIHEKYGMHPKELGKDWNGWEKLACITAYGVHNSILHWTPQRVVLGGSMFNVIGISVDSVREHVRDMMQKLPEKDIPEIIHSSLKDVGGLWGGLARLKQLRT